MNSHRIESLLSNLLQLAGHPEVLALVLFGVPLILWASHSPKYRWWPIALWGFLLPMAPRNDWLGNWIKPPFPFDQLVVHGRNASLALLVLLLPAGYSWYRKNPWGKMPIPLLGLLAMNVVYCVRYLPTPVQGLALVRLVTYLLVFVFLGVFLPRWLSSQREVIRYLSAAGTSVILFIGACLLSYMILPSSASELGRMAGLTSNANFLGGYCGYAMPVLLGLVLLPSKSSQKVLWICALALTFIVLIWTGSRGSFGMFILGVCVMFRARLGRLLLVGVPFGGLVYLFTLFFHEAQSGAIRLTSMENTRITAWIAYLGMWRKSVLFGNADLGMRPIENSYLTLAANAGIPGCLAIILFLILTARCCYLLLTLKPRDRDGEVLRDVALAGIVSMLGNSVFEATLLANLSAYTFWVFTYFGLSYFLLRYSAVTQHQVWYQTAPMRYSS
jgi:hypothetical protein